MKKLYYLIVLIVILGLIVSGCLPVVPPSEQSNIDNLTKGIILYVPIPYATIQDAIDAAAPSGDTINVADGIYIITSRILVNKEVTITGNTSSPSSVVVTYATPQSSNNGFEIGAANITIQGIKVVNCKHGFFFDRSNTTYTGCTITHCAIETASNCGIGEIATPSTTISYNTITDCGDKGIYVRYCESDSEATRTEIIGNTLSDCSKSWSCGSIQTFGSKYVYIYDNTISGTNDKGINVIRSNATGTSDRIQVIGNTIHETKWPGIQVIGAPYTYVYDNTLTQCNYYGEDGSGDFDYASIHVQDDIGPTYSNHTIIDSNTVSDGINGIQLWSDDCTVTCNTIYDMGLTYANTKTTTDGTYYNSAILYGDMYDVNMPTSATISCNNIYDNYWGLFVISTYTGTVTAEKNWWGNATGPYNASTNPFGQGDAVSDNVDYDPWSFTPDPCEAKTLGFWKNHEDSLTEIWAVYVDPFMLLGEYEVSSESEALEILNNAKAKNAYDMLAAQLLTAKLNKLHLVHLGFVAACFDAPINLADAFLIDQSYSGPGMSKPSKADKVTAIELKDALDWVNINGCGECVCEWD